MRFALVFLIGLTACTEFPALDGTVQPSQQNAAFPALIPLDPILARAGATDTSTPAAQSALTPRLAALRARAARLRGPVIPAQTRAQMLRGLR